MTQTRKSHNKDFFVLIPLWLWVFFNTLSVYTTFNSDLLNYIRLFVTYCLVRISFSLFVVITHRNDFMALVKSLIIITLGEVVYHYSKSNIFLVFMYLLSTGNAVCVHKIAKCIFSSLVPALLITVFSSFFGIIENLKFVSSTRLTRYAMGFKNPNTCGMLMAEAVLLCWYLYHERAIALFNILILGAVSYFLLQSRTAFIIILLCLFFYIVSSLKITENVKAVRLFSIADVALLFVGFALPLLISNRIIDLSKYDALFSGRINEMIVYGSNYSLTLFGQSLSIGEGLGTLNNSYLFLPLHFGIVLTFFFCLYFVKTCKVLAGRMDSRALLVVFAFLIYGFSETVLVRFEFNFSLIFLLLGAWKKSKEKKPSIYEKSCYFRS